MAELQEVAQLKKAGEYSAVFSRLERAHIISYYSTLHDVRVHFAMLRWARCRHNDRKLARQVLRLIGPATKLAIGWVPAGNTGGTHFSPIKPMPDDLAAINAAKR